MGIRINVIERCMDITECITSDEIHLATIDDEHIGLLSSCVQHGWSSTIEGQPYWSL